MTWIVMGAALLVPYIAVLATIYAYRNRERKTMKEHVAFVEKVQKVLKTPPKLTCQCAICDSHQKETNGRYTFRCGEEATHRAGDGHRLCASCAKAWETHDVSVHVMGKSEQREEVIQSTVKKLANSPKKKEETDSEWHSRKQREHKELMRRTDPFYYSHELGIDMPINLKELIANDPQLSKQYARRRWWHRTVPLIVAASMLTATVAGIVWSDEIRALIDSMF